MPRVVCERILQELAGAEAGAVIGAAPHKHSDKRTTWRHGHRDRLLTTQPGADFPSARWTKIWSTDEP